MGAEACLEAQILEVLLDHSLREGAGDQAQPGGLLGIHIIHQLAEAHLLQLVAGVPAVLVGRAVLPLHLQSAPWFSTVPGLSKQMRCTLMEWLCLGKILDCKEQSHPCALRLDKCCTLAQSSGC